MAAGAKKGLECQGASSGQRWTVKKEAALFASTDFIRGFDTKIYSDNLGPSWSNWANNYIYLGD